MSNILIFICPHCEGTIIVNNNEINCGIFRHGIYKIFPNNQMNPHSSKQECEKAVNEESIWGCGKPFKIILKDNKFNIEICDYI